LNIAIIPARKGSKRIKNKNRTLFHGKPIIYWTIKAAKKSGIFSHVYVDTDCSKIKKIALSYGAEVPFLREKKYSNDFTSVNMSTYRFVKKIKKFHSIDIKNVFQLMPNCPYRNYRDIIKSYKEFTNLNSKSLISHVRFYFSNPWWAVKIKKGKVKRIFNRAYKKRSQDLPELITPSGAIWIVDCANFLKKKSFYLDNYDYFLLDWKNGIDIDTVDEMKISKNLKF